MNRLTMLVLLVSLSPLCSRAQNIMLAKGNFEVAVSGELNTDHLATDLRFGAFVKNYIQAGIRFDWEDSDAATRLGLGTYVYRIFETRSYILPYAGAGLGFGSADAGGSNSESGLELTALGGLKYYMSDNVCLNTEFSASVSSGETFLGRDGADSTEVGLTIGISYLW